MSAAIAVLCLSTLASGQILVGSDTLTSNLWSIDIAAPASNRDMGVDARVLGLAVDDASFLAFISDSARQLRTTTYGSTGTVAPTTIVGTFTIAGSVPPVELTMQGLAYDSRDHILYGLALGSGVGGIYAINTEDAQCTLVRAFPGSSDFPGFDYNPSDDSFYFTTNLAASSTTGSESYAGTSVYRLHKPLATSRATLVAAAPAGNYDGVAAIGNLLYLVNNSNAGLSVIDMFAGTTSTLPFTWGSTPGGPFAGAAWAPGSIPPVVGADVDVRISSATPDPILLPPGGNISYTITLKNNGPNTSGTIILQDTLPAGVTFVSATPGSWTNPSGTVRQLVVTPMASGATNTYTIVGTPTTTGTLLNKVYANNLGTGGAADNRIQNNRAVWASVVRQPGADLHVTGTAPAACSVSPGGLATFSFEVTNQGDIAGASTLLAVTLPPNVSFVSSTPPLTPSGSVLNDAIGTLNPGAAQTLDVQVMVNSGRAVELNAIATTTTLEINPADNAASASTEVPGAPATSASIRGIYTTVLNVAGSPNPTSIVPGLLDSFGNPVHFRSFIQGTGDVHINPGRPYASPNGNWMIQFWDTDNPSLAQRHILLRKNLVTGTQGVVVQSGVTEVPAQQGHDPIGGPYYPWAITNLATPTFGGVQSINDSGNFAFSLMQDTRGIGHPSEQIQSRSIIKSVNNTLVLVSQATLTPAAPPYGTAPNSNYLGGIACAQIAQDNSVAYTGFNAVPSGNTWLSPAGPWLIMKNDGATLVAQVADSAQTYPAPGILGSLSVWTNQLGGTTYPAKSIHSDVGFYNTTSAVFWDATHTHYILSGLLNTAGATTRGVVVKDGQVIVQDGMTLPGFSSTAWLLDGVIGSNIVATGIRNNYRMEGNGDYFITGVNLDWSGWVIRNGSVIARTGDLIAPTSNLHWSNELVLGDRRSFSWACGNASGDYVINGRTDDPWYRGSGALVLNGTTVLARTGDPVDLNANGVFDDDYYIAYFGGSGSDGGTGEEAFLTSDALYVLAGVVPGASVNSCGGFVSPEDALVRIPLSTGPVCDSIDFNNDGLFPDTADIDDFLSVFSGGPCSNDPQCNDIDFNNDDLFPDTLDIDSFLSIFSGGPCL